MSTVNDHLSCANSFKFITLGTLVPHTSTSPVADARPVCYSTVCVIISLTMYEMLICRSIVAGQ